MASPRFDYTEVFKPDLPGVVASIIAHQELAEMPLRAVLWSNLHHAWIFAPATAARFLLDDRKFEQLQSIDRVTAEKVARQELNVELPSEDELESISDEGQRMGWDYGPPRQY